MDSNECRTLIPAARGGAGKSLAAICRAVDEAGRQFRENTKARKDRRGEW
jgi:hypothetical protein